MSRAAEIAALVAKAPRMSRAQMQHAVATWSEADVAALLDALETSAARTAAEVRALEAYGRSKGLNVTPLRRS